MKKPASSRASTILIIEAVIWIAVSLYARHLLDLAAAHWNIQSIWLLFLKIGAVLGLIAIAVSLHGLLFRWLARLGWIPPEPAEKE